MEEWKIKNLQWRKSTFSAAAFVTKFIKKLQIHGHQYVFVIVEYRIHKIIREFQTKWFKASNFDVYDQVGNGSTHCQAHVYDAHFVSNFLNI